MNLDFKKIVEEKKYLDSEKEIPEDISQHIEELKKVKRAQFKEYPEGVFEDDTRNHTLKCVYIAKKVADERVFLDTVRTLWIHDIPELITGDLTVIEKYRDSTSAKKFEKEELDAAKKLLTPRDQELLIDFNNASKLLKNKPNQNNKKASPSSLLAKIIDNSEGNLMYHYCFTKWFKSKKYDQSNLPPKDSLQHTFITNEKFLQTIEQKIQGSEKEVLVNFIKAVLVNAKRFWKEVPSERIPTVVKKHLH